MVYESSSRASAARVLSLDCYVIRFAIVPISHISCETASVCMYIYIYIYIYIYTSSDERVPPCIFRHLNESDSDTRTAPVTPLEHQATKTRATATAISYKVEVWLLDLFTVTVQYKWRVCFFSMQGCMAQSMTTLVLRYGLILPIGFRT